LIKRFTAVAAGAALAAICLTPAFAQTSPTPMSGSAMGGAMSSMDHGMPVGLAGADGVPYKGAPDLQAAISLVTAGGAPGHFSIVQAITALAGAKTANAEVAKLTKQYGAAKVASFVAVQNFAVNDAVAIATKAGVKFPSPTVHGTALAVRVTKLGLFNGTYYEGVMLDHLVTNGIHESVMGHIDGKFGAAADGNYHRIADQAHYDLAQALGAKTVKLAAYH
jgi:hypothetical protein